MTTDDSFAEYKPSPYSSVLPRVKLIKTKPLIQVVDVPPVAADNVRSSDIANDSSSGGNSKIVTPAESSTSTLAASLTRPLNGTDDAEETIHQMQPKSKVLTVINTTDADVDTSVSIDNSQTQICSTCTINIARYSCPKCSARYCSVDCYKIHDGTTDTTNTSTKQKICTESFYKNRVLGEYHARGSEEDRVKLRGILNRMHQDIGIRMDDVEWREHSLSQLLKENDIPDIGGDVMLGMDEYNQRLAVATVGDGGDRISDEELAELASYILNLEEDENDPDSAVRVQQLRESIPPHLLNSFECALASAIDAECHKEDGFNLINERNQQQTNAKWRPWWLPDTDEGLEKDDIALSPNLDERILSIQKLPSLVSQTTNRNLVFNILDVLFATCFALRVTSSNGATEHAPDLLLSQSLVLCNNANYESVNEVLSSCAQHFVEMSKAIGINSDLSWHRLASDISLLSCNRRYVLRLLFEATDLFEYGKKLVRMHTKALTKKNKKVHSEDKIQFDETKRRYKLAIKKIEYFQSWCSHMWTAELSCRVSEEIDSFVGHWRMPERVEKTSRIESMLGDMLKEDDDNSDMNRIESTTVRIARKNDSFRLGNELVAVSTQKMTTR